MMKEEFESRLGGPVSDAEYRDIEYVYQFYPTIDTKDQIVDLYKIGGMRLIRDMIPTARQAQVLWDKVLQAQRDLEKARDRYEALRKGATYDRSISED